MDRIFVWDRHSLRELEIEASWIVNESVELYRQNGDGFLRLFLQQVG